MEDGRKCALLALWLIFGPFVTQTRSKMTYYLSKDCQIPLTRESLHLHPDTRYLRVDNLDGGLVLQSHDWHWPPKYQLGNQSQPLGGSGGGSNQSHTAPSASLYPRGFSCEIVVHTPVENAKIMMKIEEFYVPSVSEDCEENYMYVFDSNTAKSKAMPEARGERGLCRASYPRHPIFTSKSYICIAFHTSIDPSPIPSNYRPGFRVILTSIHDTTTSTCQSGYFYCGTRPRVTHMDSKSHPVHEPVPFTHLLSFGSSSSSLSSSSSSSSVIGSTSSLTDTTSLSTTNTDPSRTTVLGYCIPERTICDGIANCADARDESVTRCGTPNSALGDSRHWPNGDRKSSGWLLGLLSLGIPASIAIAVSTIVTFTICIGAIICCCNRCCCRPHPYRSRYPRIVADGLTHLTTLNSSSVPGATGGYQHPNHHRISGSSSAVVLGTGTRANLASWLHRGRHTPGTAAWNPHLPISSTAYASFFSYTGGSQPGSMGQLISTTGPHPLAEDQKSGAAAYRSATLVNQQVALGLQQQFAMRSMGKGTRTEVCAGHEQMVTAGSRLMSSVGPPSSGSYSSIHANSSGQAGYSVYPRPPGPPPALVHGAMGSPLTYRRDTFGTDPFCYTPPPYGACTVPPASSVTASSSRTGTTSGGVGATGASIGTAWPSHGVMATESGLITAGGSMDGASATDLCPTGSNGILYGHQLSGGGNSALHTNTPVETVSQGGGGGTGLPVTGGDMISNGGILYLGELPQADDAAPIRHRGFPCGPSGGPGSTTTGSGSSHGRKLRAHTHRRLFLQECQPVDYSSQLECHSSQTQHRLAGDSSVSTSQRLRLPSNRSHHQHPHFHHHRRRYHHRSSDPLRAAVAAASSGSHTPASSRSGLPTTSSQRSGELPNPQLVALPTSDTTVSFPVEL